MCRLLLATHFTNIESCLINAGNVVFLRLYLQHGITSCPDWVNRSTLLKLADISRELEVFIEQKCNCSLPPSLLTTSSQFTCVAELPQHVVYRASVQLSSLPVPLDRSMLVDILETWPVLHRAVLVQGERLSVEESCAVVILSPEEQQCTLTSAPPTVSLSTFLVTVFTVVIFFTLAAVAMVIIFMAIRAAKQRKATSQRYVTFLHTVIGSRGGGGGHPP